MGLSGIKAALCAALIVTCSAGAVENTPLWQGFKAADDAAIPPAVRALSDSIFQIFYPHGPVEILDVSGIDVSKMSTSEDQWFKIIEVKVCQNQHIAKCPVTGHTFSGTAFLIRDAQTLATNLHNIQGWYYNVLKNNPGLKIDDLQGPFLLVDGKGQLAYLPTDPKFTMKVSFYNKSPKTFTLEYPWEPNENSVFFRMSDYVELHFSHASSFRKPVPLIKYVDPSVPLYLVGFPISQNEGLWTSVGKLNKDLMFTNFSTNNASSPGSSGSPLLTAAGEAVGLLYGGSEGKSDFLSLDHEQLKATWEFLD